MIKQYTYGYDLASNRTSERVANKTTTSTRNNVNEITSQTNPARTLTYNLNGSLINDGKSRTFEWDAANRLVAVNYAGTMNRSEFSYDGLSRLAKIVETSSGAITSTTKFINCGTEKCEYRNANDAVTLRLYDQGQYSGTTPYYYTRDHLGSIREMFKSDGTVVARYDYDSWGRVTTNIGTTKPDFNFTGLYRLTKSNLDVATYRFYDPDLGRWLSRDPIEEAGGVNLYGYIGNNPHRFRDPLGLAIVVNNTNAPIIVSGNIGADHGTEGAQAFGVILPGHTGGGKDNPIQAYPTREDAVNGTNPSSVSILDVDFYDSLNQKDHSPKQCDNKVIGDDQGPVVRLSLDSSGNIISRTDLLTLPGAYRRRILEKLGF